MLTIYKASAGSGKTFTLSATFIAHLLSDPIDHPHKHQLAVTFTNKATAEMKSRILLTNMNKWTDNMDTSKWYYLDVQEATNSHGYTRKTFNYELWRQMLPDPDWSRYER